MDRSLRLRKNEEFKRVYRRGLPAYNRDFKLVGFHNGMNHNRYGFSMSKKFGKANERNRMKRRLREIVRAHQEIFPLGFDYVFLPRPTAKKLDYQQLEHSLIHCLGQWKKRMENKKQSYSNRPASTSHTTPVSARHPSQENAE